MKKVITIMGIFGLMIVQAQVGINNDKPDATLDVAAEKTDGTQVEGLLVPRISKLAASTMAGNTNLKESTLVYINNTADYTTTPVATSVVDITENGYYFWNGSKWVKTAGKDGAEWVYNSTTKQIDLKRSGLTPSINKIFYDEKGRYRSLAEEETYSINRRAPNYTSVAVPKSLNSSDNIAEATVFESINSKNNVTFTDLNGFQSKRHTAKTYLVNKSDMVKYHVSKSNNMIVPIENTNDYNSVYSAGSNVVLNGAGTIANSIATWGGVTVSGSQKVSDYVTGMLAESSYRSSGAVNALYGLNARIFNFAGTGTVEYSAAINSASTTPRTTTNDATLIRHNYGIKNSLRSTSNNTGAGVELASITTTTTHTGKTKYPNMYGIKSATTIGTATGVVKPTNLYGLWLGDAKGAEQGNYAIYTNAGKVRFGDNVGIGVDAPAEKLEVNGNIKVQDTGGTTLTDGTACDNPGTISYSGGSFFGCTGASVWKKLHN